MIIFKVNRATKSFTIKRIQRKITVSRVGRPGATGPQGPQGPPGDPATNLVTSVNGKQGVVVLDASDVNAVESIQAGANIIVDNTDPQNPIVNATGTTSISFDNVTDKPLAPAFTGLLVNNATDAEFPTDQAEYSIQPDPMTFAYRDSDGTLKAAAAVDNDDLVQKIQLTNGLATKVTEHTIPSTVYAVDSDGEQQELAYSTNDSGYTIAQRGATGTLKAAPAVDNDDLVQKIQLDMIEEELYTDITTGLAGKVDILPGNNIIYSKNSSGVHAGLTYSAAENPNTIAQRNATGQLLGTDPTANNHLATKLYVDTADALKADFPSTNSHIPVRNASGGQTSFPYSNAPGASNVIPVTKTNGRLNTGTPVDNTDATTKLYVDTADALKANVTDLANYVLKAGDTMTGNLGTLRLAPNLNNAYDIGTSSLYYNIGYIRTLNTGQAIIPSTGSGIALYNTVDQTTNYERVRMYWDSNIYRIISERAGTGVTRAINISSVAAGLQFNTSSVTGGGALIASGTAGASGSNFFAITPTYTMNAGSNSIVSILPTYNQTGTAGGTDLLINRTQTSVGSGVQNLIDAQVGGVSRFAVSNMGNITMADLSTGGNIVVGTTNGTMIGTATTQKIGFFGVNPIVQPGATTELLTLLNQIGLRAAGSAVPITTSGTVTLSGPLNTSSINTHSGGERDIPNNITASTTLNTFFAKNERITATGSTAINVTLPTTTTAGHTFRFYRTDANPAVVTILGTINGNASGYVLSAQYKYVEVVSTSVSGAWEVWSNN